MPNEASAKVYLAGVRSRAAALELGAYVRNPSASISKIRKSLLNPETIERLSAVVSASTTEWLRILAGEMASTRIPPPQCSSFSLNVPSEMNIIHVRRKLDGSIFLCSQDSKFRYEVDVTPDFPFDKIANDPRFIFARAGQNWNLASRDPRVQIPKLRSL